MPLLRKSRLPGARNSRLIHNDGAALHDPTHVFDGDLDVSERVALYGDDIGKVAWGKLVRSQLAELVAEFLLKSPLAIELAKLWVECC
jgi:hypothetical protein